MSTRHDSRNCLVDGAQVAGVVAAFCQRTGMKTGHFGDLCLDDRNFYSDLMNGRQVRLSTFNKVKAFIERRDQRVNMVPKLVSAGQRPMTRQEELVSFRDEHSAKADAVHGCLKLELAMKRYAKRVAEWNSISVEQATEALMGKEPVRKGLPIAMARPARHDFTLAGVSSGMLAA